VVVDRYGDHALLVTYATAVSTIVPAIAESIESLGVVKALLTRREGDGGLEPLFGSVPEAPIVVDEHGVRLQVDLAHGQKTGLFLDQRDNRRFVGNLSAGRRVLNLFSYTGGFSLHAVKGGAPAVTSVDSAAPAMQAARENFALNGFSTDGHEFVVADVFEHLGRVQQARQRFDLVICDPPSFAKSKEQRERALTAYVRLNAQALGAVERNGLYAAASCTSQIGPEAFIRMLGEAAQKAKRRLQIIHEAGQAIDHPQFAGHPEGRYLKFVVGRVLDAP
jgi:23S rRNA (cytosine1962-C5)-methyltransferase